MIRAQTILSKIHEVEKSYSDTPRKMVRLTIFLDSHIAGSLDDFRRWLVLHGLGRYIENLVPKEHDFITNSPMSYGSHRMELDYTFVFPRNRLEDVRYLEHIITSYLIHEHPNYLTPITPANRYFPMKRPFESFVDFFTYTPRHGGGEGGEGDKLYFTNNWDVIHRFQMSQYKKGDPRNRGEE